MEKVDVAKTALLVMDFQNDIVDAKGVMGSQGMAAQVQEKKATQHTATALAAARRGRRLCRDRTDRLLRQL